MTENTDYLWCIAGMMDGILSPLENKSKNLQSKEYMIDKKYAIESYFDWKLNDVINYKLGVLF